MQYLVRCWYMATTVLIPGALKENVDRFSSFCEGEGGTFSSQSNSESMPNSWRQQCAICQRGYIVPETRPRNDRLIAEEFVNSTDYPESNVK